MTEPLPSHLSKLHSSPLVGELTSLFDTIENDRLADWLSTPITRRGPKGNTTKALLRITLASYYLSHDSLSDTVRQLQNNLTLANWCLEGAEVPSRSTLSRFNKRLDKHHDLLQAMLAKQADMLHARLPGFGQHIAIDSTTVYTHSNPDHKDSIDKDASWTAKGYKVGSNQKQWSFGMKLHMAVDATYELPISMYVTTAKSADSQNLSPLLESARNNLEWFDPETVLADKGYDALHNYKTIVEEYHATPVIPIRAMHPGAKKRRAGTELRTAIDRDSEEWKRLYAYRTSVERCFGRLKEHRRLERHCFQGLPRITTHCLLSVIVLQAKALAQSEGNLNQCLRAVA